MKCLKKIVLLLLCFSPVLINAQRSEDETKVFSTLEDLFKAKDYFSLKEEFEEQGASLSEKNRYFFNAVFKNAFHQPAASNSHIETYLELEGPTVNDSLLSELYQMKLLNHIHLYEYAQAAQTGTALLEKFSGFINGPELDDLQNELKIWNALRDVPPQQLMKSGDITLPIIMDKAGLSNVEVGFGNETRNLIFDTGANFSVIGKSLVEELQLQFLPTGFKVTAATGVEVDSDLAIAPTLTIGGITLQNVVFLVFEDEDLAFPQIDYQIQGIIGFPVIKAMEEIRIRAGKQIFIPEVPILYKENNFALSGFMPIVSTLHLGNRLRFQLDTGATNTVLFPLFHKEYMKEIGESEKVHFYTGSAGGTAEFEGYILPQFELAIGTRKVILENISVHSETVGDTENKFHGNLGQDFIGRFGEMILSFRDASIIFKE